MVPLGDEIRRSYFDEYPGAECPLDENDVTALEDFLRMALVIDPKHRATPQVLLDCPWILPDHPSPSFPS